MFQHPRNTERYNRQPAPALSTVPRLEALEGRQLFASALAYGINVNSLSGSTYGATVKMLRATGTKSVRVWYGFSSYGERQETGVGKYVRKLAADGFDVMLAVVPSNGKVGTPEQVKGLISYLANIPGMAAAVDRWQIGNEPDHKNYWSGSLSSYVTNFLAPAASVLHGKGEKVVSAGPSWNPADVKKMVDAGMLKYADFVGYHPYRSNVADLKARVAEVKKIVGGKPLIASEWNIRGREGNASSWNAGIKEFWPVIRDNFYAAYYYAAVKSGTYAGKGAVINANGSANGAFYGTYQSLRTGNSASAVVGPTIVSGSALTSKPTASTSKPAINGFKIVDGRTGAIIVSKVIQSQTIKLSSLPTRNIQIIALTGGDTESVKFKFSGAGTHIENGEAYKTFAQSGGASTWNAKVGTFSITATAYGSDDASGVVGGSISLGLTFA